MHFICFMLVSYLQSSLSAGWKKLDCRLKRTDVIDFHLRELTTQNVVIVLTNTDCLRESVDRETYNQKQKCTLGGQLDKNLFSPSCVPPGRYRANFSVCTRCCWPAVSSSLPSDCLCCASGPGRPDAGTMSSPRLRRLQSCHCRHSYGALGQSGGCRVASSPGWEPRGRASANPPSGRPWCSAGFRPPVFQEAVWLHLWQGKVMEYFKGCILYKVGVTRCCLRSDVSIFVSDQQADLAYFTYSVISWSLFTNHQIFLLPGKCQWWQRENVQINRAAFLYIKHCSQCSDSTNSRTTADPQPCTKSAS